MFFLQDINIEFSDRRKVKVKSFVRKGKLVRSYDREQVKAGLIGAGIGAASVLGLGGAYLLGKRGTIPKKLVTEMLENQNKNIKTVVKEALENQKTPVINFNPTINTPEIRIPVQPSPVIKLEMPQNMMINNVGGIRETSNKTRQIINDVIEEIQIPRVAIPKKNYNLSSKSVEKLELSVKDKSDQWLLDKIADLDKKEEPYRKVYDNLLNATDLEKNIDMIKNPQKYLVEVTDRAREQGITEGSAQKSIQQITKDIRSLREKLGLPRIVSPDVTSNSQPKGYIEVYDKLYTPKLDDKELLVKMSEEDKLYKEQLSKYLGRQTAIKQVYKSVLSKRNSAKPKVVAQVDDDDVERMKGFLDDSFSFIGDLVNFNNVNDFIFLTDVSFARRQGSKDKKKRKYNLLSNVIAPSGLGAATLGGLGYLALNRRSIPKKIKVASALGFGGLSGTYTGKLAYDVHKQNKNAWDKKNYPQLNK